MRGRYPTATEAKEDPGDAPQAILRIQPTGPEVAFLRQRFFPLRHMKWRRNRSLVLPVGLRFAASASSCRCAASWNPVVNIAKQVPCLSTRPEAAACAAPGACAEQELKGKHSAQSRRHQPVRIAGGEPQIERLLVELHDWPRRPQADLAAE